MIRFLIPLFRVHCSTITSRSSIPGGGGHDGAGGWLPHGGSLYPQHPSKPLSLEHHHPVHWFLRWRREERKDPCVLHRRGAQRQEGRWGWMGLVLLFYLSVLGQDTVPQIALDSCADSVWMVCNRKIAAYWSAVWVCVWMIECDLDCQALWV